MNESIDLQDLELSGLPKNKKLIVFSYGSIYQYQTNFKIAIILKELYKDLPEYFVWYLNLKEIYGFPLGTVIENQHKTGLNAGDIINFQINIENGILKTKGINDITVLGEFMDNLPDKIGNFNVEWHRNQQKYSTFIDNFSGRMVIFPHYEILRYFYFTSASMVRHIMTGSLKENSSLNSLYKRATLDKGNAEICLKFNANNTDAENIFRFVVDKKANNMWQQVRRDLAASKVSSEQRKRDLGLKDPQGEMTIQANFPVSGIVNFKARVKILDDGSLIVLRIIQEDTLYPFLKLKVIREFLSGKEDIVGIIKGKMPSKKSLTNKFNTKIPSSLYDPINIINSDEDTELEKRLDLLNKVIEFETRIEEGEDKEVKRNACKTKKELDLSPNDSERQGDFNTVEGLLVKDYCYRQEDTEDYIKIEDFKAMLLYCSEQYEDFSYKILRCENLPQKPKNYGGRYAWKRSKMIDEITPRKYIVVEIDYKNCRYIIIEIQKDKLIDALSTLVIIDYHNSVDEDILKAIAINIAKTSNSWLQNLKFEITKHFLYHPYDTREEKIQDWGKRLKYVLDKFQKNS